MAKHQEHETPKVMITVFDGTTIDFLSLPYDSVVKLAQKGWTRNEQEAAAGASAKGRAALATERSAKKAEVTNDDLKAVFYGLDAPRTAQWEAWRNELMAAFRDKAISGELETVAPTQSQVQKDRIEAIVKAIGEALDAKNAERRAQGLQGYKPYFEPIKHGKGVAEENEQIRLRNEQRINEQLQRLDNGSFPFTDLFEKHLAAIRAERAAKAKPTAVDATELSSLDDLMNDEVEQAAQ